MSVRDPLFAWLTIGLLCGCSGGSSVERRPTHKVSGTITMAGAPVANADVTFAPKDKQPVALGRTDSQGKYTLTTYSAGDGAVAGNYVVLVSKSGGSSTTGELSHEDFVSGRANPAAAHAGGGRGAPPPSGSLLPDKYASIATSDLEATVEAGKTNVFDFELKP